jgi:hypothetical protein
MNKIGCILIVVCLISACATQQFYYSKSNLNNISIGQTKQELLKKFPGENKPGGAPPMQIRAAQKSNSKLIEVGELRMADSVSPVVAYWFLFEDGALVQWGQPEDWKDIKARYEISYNPSIGVSP